MIWSRHWRKAKIDYLSVVKYFVILLLINIYTGLSAQDFIATDLRDSVSYFHYSDSEFSIGQKLIIVHKPPVCKSFIAVEDPLVWYYFDSLYNFMAHNSKLGYRVTFHNYSSLATTKTNKWVSQLMAEEFVKKYNEDGFGNLNVISEGLGSSQPLFLYQNKNNDKTVEDSITSHKIAYGNRCEVEIIAPEETKFEFSDSIFILGQEKRMEFRWSLSNGNIMGHFNNPSFDSIQKFLLKNESIHVSIIMHTDTRGRTDANMKLSQLRAEAIKSELVSRGISEDRIEAIGKGEYEPIHSEEDINQYKRTDARKFEELHQINRRTIIRIIKI